jgi:hypothetical protein
MSRCWLPVGGDRAPPGQVVPERAPGAGAIRQPANDGRAPTATTAPNEQRRPL